MDFEGQGTAMNNGLFNSELEASYAHCQQIARNASSSFYYSFLLLARPQRQAMCALYAFLRRTDDLGDCDAPLAERRIAKTYSALVIGRPAKDQLTIDLPLGRDPQHPLRQAVVPNGRPAVTDYEVKTIFKGYTLLEVRPQTGRTHQIRIHLAAIGHPIAGDAVYGPSTRPIGLTRQFLHAIKLELTGPSGQQISISSQLSPDLQAFLDTLQT